MKPTCTDCGKPDSATVYVGSDGRLCGDCYAAPPKEIVVYVGGALGPQRWWWNSSAGGTEVTYIRADLVKKNPQGDPTRTEAYRRLHRLWTWAVGRLGYEKKEWQQLEQDILELLKRPETT